MKITNYLIIIILALLISCSQNENHKIKTISEKVTLSGKVTDFDGNPIDSALIGLLSSNFSVVDSAYSDTDGFYKMDINKGRYYSMWVLRPEEYPTQNAVPPEDMRLEFWAWNIIADRDLTINPRYQRLELYRLNAMKGEGGALMIYVRPMSLGRSLEFGTDEKDDVTVTLENFKPKVFIDEEQVNINSIQIIEEFTGKDREPLIGYLIQVNLKKATNKPYYVIRLEAMNLEYNEKGESVFFFDNADYK